MCDDALECYSFLQTLKQLESISYLMVDYKRPAATETADGSDGVLHVGADQVNVIDLVALNRESD